MKSPAILLMFVVAIINCFNICDGADNYAKDEIRIMKGTVQRYVDDLNKFYAEHGAAIEKMLNEIKEGLPETMDKIINTTMAKIEKYAEPKKTANTRPCIESANDDLTKLKEELIKRFDDVIKSVKQKQSTSESMMDKQAKYIILQCNNFLSLGGNAKSRKKINAEFRRFKKKYVSEKKLISLEELRDDLRANHPAQKIIEDLHKRTQSIVESAKSAIDKL